MKIVFMGTPDFAVPSLRAMSAHHEVVLVVTRPDAVRGRGKKLVPSAVKQCAQELGLPVAEARKVDAALLEQVKALAPDVICVAAYGAILPDALLAIPRLDCVNVHGSLLPRWRGAAPIQRGILAGDKLAGVSIMRVVHDLDAGPWCRQASVEIADKPCFQVMDEVARAGARELLVALDEIEQGTAVWHDQDEALVTYAHKIDKHEMLLDPCDSVRDNALRVQASTDAAPARLSLSGRGVRVLRARALDGRDGEGSSSPDGVGTVPQELGLHQGAVLVSQGRLLLGCADGALELLEVKPDGKRAMAASSWAQGLRGTDLTWGVA